MTEWLLIGYLIVGAWNILILCVIETKKLIKDIKNGKSKNKDNKQ